MGEAVYRVGAVTEDFFSCVLGERGWGETGRDVHVTHGEADTEFENEQARFQFRSFFVFPM